VLACRRAVARAQCSTAATLQRRATHCRPGRSSSATTFPTRATSCPGTRREAPAAQHAPSGRGHRPGGRAQRGVLAPGRPRIEAGQERQGPEARQTTFFTVSERCVTYSILFVATNIESPGANGGFHDFTRSCAICASKTKSFLSRKRIPRLTDRRQAVARRHERAATLSGARVRLLALPLAALQAGCQLRARFVVRLRCQIGRPLDVPSVPVLDNLRRESRLKTARR